MGAHRFQFRRSSAALPPGRDLCSRGRATGDLDAVGVGWARPQLLPLEPTDLRTCAMNGLRPASYCRLVADFRRTTCEHLDEHLRALISGQT
jgi:hypothetical protein